MSIPKQVEENAEIAEELMKASAEELEEAEEPPVEGPEEETEEDGEQDPPEGEDDEELTFKQRYEALQGKYNAEVPRLHDELKTLKASVLEKLGQLSEPKKPEPEKQEQEPEIYARIREEYGDEYLDMLSQLTDAKAREVAKQMIAETVKPVEEDVSSVKDAQLQSARKSFEASLDQQVPEAAWRQLWEGEDPGFQEFLEQEDPSGLYTYGDLLKNYLEAWDDKKTAKVFNLYLEQKGPKKPSNKDKESLLAPSRTTPQSTPKEQGKIIWTREKIKEFEVNDRQGVYSEEESQKLWNDLLSAPGENRIR